VANGANKFTSIVHVLNSLLQGRVVDEIDAGTVSTGHVNEIDVSREGEGVQFDRMRKLTNSSGIVHELLAGFSKESLGHASGINRNGPSVGRGNNHVVSLFFEHVVGSGKLLQPQTGWSSIEVSGSSTDDNNLRRIHRRKGEPSK
jgi:hypothetical protein